jgi:4-amino-4-deoxychorismate lyase
MVSEPAAGVLVNGVAAASVSVYDRGLHYGDGLFETVAWRGGQALSWDRHMLRLQDGCARLGMSIPEPGRLWDELRRLTQGTDRGVVKIVLTRGSGGRGYRPPTCAAGTRILALYPCPDYPAHFAAEGVRVRVCETRLGLNPALAGLKHLNRLEQVLARAEWQDPEVPEGLMLDCDGWVIAGTQSNLFIVRAGRLLTPDLSRCGVAGVMRACVMDRAGTEGIPCEVRRFGLTEVLKAEEAFLCNSLIGLWPVRELAGIPLPLGPIARRMAACLCACA